MLKRLLLFLVILLTWSLSTSTVIAQMSITITSPQNKEHVDPCGDIVFTSDITVTSGTIKEVRYYYNDTKSIGLVRKEPYSYTWKNVKQGYYVVTAKVVDTDGNEFWSTPVDIQVGNALKGDMIINGGFDCSLLAPWGLQLSGAGTAKATATVLNEGYFEDSSFVYIDITDGSDTDWHIQFYQPMAIQTGHTYEVWFQADADGQKPIVVAIQGNSDDYPLYLYQNVTIDGPQEYGPFTYESTTDNTNCQFKFNIGANKIPMMIDNVRIYDLSATSINVHDYSFGNKTVKQYELFQSYPNPFNMNTKIPFRLSQTANVILEIFNMQGQKVRTLVNGVQSEGMHNINWDGTNDSGSVLSSGVYLYRFQVKDEKIDFSNKVLLLK